MSNVTISINGQEVTGVEVGQVEERHPAIGRLDRDPAGNLLRLLSPEDYVRETYRKAVEEGDELGWAEDAEEGAFRSMDFSEVVERANRGGSGGTYVGVCTVCGWQSPMNNLMRMSQYFMTHRQQCPDAEYQALPRADFEDEWKMIQRQKVRIRRS